MLKTMFAEKLNNPICRGNFSRFSAPLIPEPAVLAALISHHCTPFTARIASQIARGPRVAIL